MERNELGDLAIIVVLIGVVPVLPGSIKAVAGGGIIADPSFVDNLYTYGLFFTFFVAAIAYLVLNLIPSRSPEPETTQRPLCRR